jgi:hypothetical protein
LLDDKGNVIKDKFLRIDEISIDKKPITIGFVSFDQSLNAKKIE